MENLQHLADRPSWRCRVCDEPWPCPPAREHLARTLDPTGLAMYMWANFEEAIFLGHLTLRSSPNAYERFIGWTRASRRA